MHLDAIVIGGSFAGLSAAMYIARARRSVCIIDTGAPRNRFAAHAHGFFAQDGSAPAAMLATARAQVARYPTVSFIEGEAVDAASGARGFTVKLATGEELESTALVLAFGISDELPEIPGLAERWGNSVLHCPYCHGFEFGGQRLGVLNMSPMSVHQVSLIAEWGPTTLYLNGAPEPDAATLADLQKRRIAIERAPLKALRGEGKQLSAIAFDDGRTSDVSALFIAPPTRLNSGIGARLGCAMEDAPLGPIIRTDAQKMTSVPGVFAAGDITRGAHSATFASADGVMAGTALHRSLAF